MLRDKKEHIVSTEPMVYSTIPPHIYIYIFFDLPLFFGGGDFFVHKGCLYTQMLWRLRRRRRKSPSEDQHFHFREPWVKTTIFLPSTGLTSNEACKNIFDTSLIFMLLYSKCRY